MNTNQILSADLLDLIFDDRNKEYGAYELRKTYQPRIVKALFITTGIALIAFAGNLLAGSLKDDTRRKVLINPIELSSIPEKEEPPPVIEIKKPEPVPVRTEHLATPTIVDDKDVQEPPPSIDDLENAKIDVIKQDGEDFTNIAQPSDIDGKTGIIEQKKEDVPTGPYTVVQVEARFNGNWIKFLERNLNSAVPVDNGAPVGKYQVMMQFVVDVDGSVSDIRALSNVGYGMEQEAIRVLKRAAKWEPAIQNGHQVKAYRRQSIIFEVLEN